MGFERDETIYTTKAVDEEPDIIRAARMFDEAQRNLENMKQQRKKIDDAMRGAQEQMNEAAARLRSHIDILSESKRIP